MLNELQSLTFNQQLHIITGTVCFFVGPSQFIHYIREKYTMLHRLFGRTYVINTLLSSATGFFISFNTHPFLAAAGTAIQSVLWFAFTVLAYICVRNKNFTAHRRWMIRSYALVLAAVAVRILIEILNNFTTINFIANFNYYYPFFVWLSFFPLAFAEIYIRSSAEATIPS